MTKHCFLSVLVASMVLLTGCETVQYQYVDNNIDEPIKIKLQRLVKKDVEGVSIYYRDLSENAHPQIKKLQIAKEIECKPGEQLHSEKSQSNELINNVAYTTIENEQAPRVFTRNGLIPEQEVLERTHPIYFEFKNALNIDDGSVKVVEALASYQHHDIFYKLWGTAGVEGQKAEALAAKRASYVEQRLIDLGVPSNKVVLMPYDPKMDGLRAVVKMESY